MNTSPWPPVAVIVLNWNGRAFLGDCLRSLLALDYPALSLVVVDNASEDGSLPFLQATFPQVPLIRNAQNRGFAAGNNVALRQLQADFLVLANPDIVVPPEWLRQLIGPMLADERIGVAGCKLFFPDGRLQHAGGIIRAPLGLPAYIGAGEEDDGRFDRLQDVDYVIGAAFAMRRRALEQVGLLDEGYFLYYEEVDLCARMRRAGYRVVFVPQARLTHVESATTPKGDARYLERMHTSRWRYLLKHGDEGSLLAETMPAEEAWLAGRNPGEKVAAAQAYWHTIRKMPAILQARVAHGAPALTPAGQRAVTQALQALRHQALAPQPEVTGRLQGGWRVAERPFRSRLPLFAPLVARLRTAWLDVAARWYVRPQLEQQNRFNEIAGSQVASLQRRLSLVASDQAALAQSLAELEQEMARLPGPRPEEEG